MRLAPHNHPRKSEYIDNQSSSLFTRFERLGNLADLNTAIEGRMALLDSLPEEDQNKPRFLNLLAYSFLARFQRQGRPADLDAAIEHYLKAKQLAPDTNPNKLMTLDGLGGAFYIRFARQGQSADLDTAIEYSTKVTRLTPPNHPQKPMFTSNLGNWLVTRFRHLGNPADLDLAIRHQEEAVRLAPDGHPYRHALLGSLGNSLRVRFQQLGIDADLNAAIEHLEKARQLIPTGFINTALALDNLGGALRIRYDRLGRLPDLDLAIQRQTESVQLTPDDHPEKPLRLSNLGGSLRVRFRRLGSLVDLDGSIERHTEAVEHTPDGHPERPMRLSNLGNSLGTRFRQHGSLVDLDKAIQYAKEAALLMPDRHAGKPGCLSGLGASLLARFTRVGNLADLDAGMEHGAKAVALTSKNDPNKPLYLEVLAQVLCTRFQRLGELTDLDAAILRQKAAVDLMSQEHPDMPRRLCDFGHLLRIRFQQQGQHSAATRVADSVPEAHLSSLMHMLSIKVPSQSQYSHLKEHPGLAESLECFKRAATLRSGTPTTNFDAAIAWARLSCEYGLHESSLEAYGRVVELIPRIPWLGSTVNRRYKEIAVIALLPMEAAAMAIYTNKFNLALEWLESVRSVVWKQTLQLRAPLHELRPKHARLADELEQVARDLDMAGSLNLELNTELGCRLDLEKAIHMHHTLAPKWEGLVDQARKLPGFERFLMPKEFAELTKSSNISTVVVINVHKTRCDALALYPGTSSTIHIPLASFSRNQCLKMQNNLLAALRNSGMHMRSSRRPLFESPIADDMFKDVLATLWRDVVKPILSGLQYLTLPTQNKLPRVTWCATGPLAFLPLHAAGYYSDPPERTFDYVISSYTPTLDALLRTSQSPNEFGGVLAVGQANLTSQSPLPGTVTELKKIQELAGSLRFTRLVEGQATPEAVLTEMQRHSWVHFACHGSQELLDPTKSAFQLHHGNLDLITIIRNPPQSAEMAFLSACETATGDEKLPDEAVHLAAGMLMSGYRTVIATMWSIQDADAPLVTEHFYSQLLKGGVPNSEGAAEALHDAVGILRAKVGDGAFWRWVPYIHVGQ
ncbi:hypothetical protein FRC09_002507 [Ceratobasidium sp. 395]|nr:hypothetical protein FRC09_002507 [Ceratobasidium sp. 395]